MPSPELRSSIELIRREAELACESGSLRSVAGEIGMSAMGLRAFINRTHQPQKRTLRKLTVWFTGRAATRESRGEGEARSALGLLAGLYPPADRSRVLGNLLDQMEREFRASGMQPPPWLATLADELRRGGETWSPHGVESGPDFR